MMQLRELSGTIVVGQELPMLRVPAPTAREVKCVGPASQTASVLCALLGPGMLACLYLGTGSWGSHLCAHL
jgi:hypothetical protein